MLLKHEPKLRNAPREWETFSWDSGPIIQYWLKREVRRRHDTQGPEERIPTGLVSASEPENGTWRKRNEWLQPLAIQSSEVMWRRPIRRLR